MLSHEQLSNLGFGLDLAIDGYINVATSEPMGTISGNVVDIGVLGITIRSRSEGYTFIPWTVIRYVTP